MEIDIAAKMPKAAILTEHNREQLVAGHMRIDFLKPMTKGNLVLFKGDKYAGKTQVACDVI